MQAVGQLIGTPLELAIRQRLVRPRNRDRIGPGGRAGREELMEAASVALGQRRPRPKAPSSIGRTVEPRYVRHPFHRARLHRPCLATRPCITTSPIPSLLASRLSIHEPNLQSKSNNEPARPLYGR
jgi:hypothetical protein